MGRNSAYFTGEFVGTFILVFFGCSSVAASILFPINNSLFQIAALWGIAVTMAIYATRHLSCAHLNPAVSIAMVIGGRMTAKKLPVYLSAQFSGAFCAAIVLYAVFSGSIIQFEFSNQIIRGNPESIKTAMIFGEFFPNPVVGEYAVVSVVTAFLAEFIGTFALVFFIFSITEKCNLGRPGDIFAPLFIGMALMVIIAVIAPFTQAGLNPARDLGPRLFAMLAGWGSAAFPVQPFGFLTVYVIAPITGGSCAALFFTRIIEPFMRKEEMCCS